MVREGGRSVGAAPVPSHFCGTSAHFPKLVLHRRTHSHELRKVMGTSKHIDPSAAFLFEVRGSTSLLVVQEFQIGGTRCCPRRGHRRLRCEHRPPKTAW